LSFEENIEITAQQIPKGGKIPPSPKKRNKTPTSKKPPQT